MSCALYWRPVAKNRKRVGDSALRQAIEDEFGRECRLNGDALPFLRGLVAANVDGAKALIEAIEKHADIELWQER